MKRLRVKGRFISKELERQLTTIARNKDYDNPQDYINENKDQIQYFINKGYTALSKSPENVIEIILNSGRKNVYVLEDGLREPVPAFEVIERVSELQQYAVNNSNIVSLGIEVRAHLDNSITVIVPSPDYYEDAEGEELEHLLDEYEVFTVSSKKEQ